METALCLYFFEDGQWKPSFEFFFLKLPKRAPKSALKRALNEGFPNVLRNITIEKAFLCLSNIFCQYRNVPSRPSHKLEASDVTICGDLTEIRVTGEAEAEASYHRGGQSYGRGGRGSLRSGIN